MILKLSKLPAWMTKKNENDVDINTEIYERLELIEMGLGRALRLIPRGYITTLYSPIAYPSISFYCCCLTCLFFLICLLSFPPEESGYMYLDNRLISFISKQLQIFVNLISSFSRNLFRNYAFCFGNCRYSLLLLFPLFFRFS